jgi:hypothetical protein
VTASGTNMKLQKGSVGPVEVYAVLGVWMTLTVANATLLAVAGAQASHLKTA